MVSEEFEMHKGEMNINTFLIITYFELLGLEIKNMTFWYLRDVGASRDYIFKIRNLKDCKSNEVQILLHFFLFSI